MTAQIRVGDIGTVIRLTFKDENNAPLNISAQTTLEFYFQKPDRTVVVKNASVETDGSDGSAIYTLVQDDIDQDGNWKIEGKVALPTGTWKTDIHIFPVGEVLPEPAP